jgi:hypothetical protein
MKSSLYAHGEECLSHLETPPSLKIYPESGDPVFVERMTEEERESNQITHDTVMRDILHAFNGSVQDLSKEQLRSFTYVDECLNRLQPLMLEFTQWAFGPRGFAELKVLANGDFSHGKRFKWSQLLFCRADPARVSSASTGAAAQPAKFRIMTKDDEYLLDQIKGSRQMLSACPIE